jgi:hypothetical protein
LINGQVAERVGARRLLTIDTARPNMMGIQAGKGPAESGRAESLYLFEIKENFLGFPFRLPVKIA